MGMVHRIQEQVFKHIHFNHLVYNTCWEDPRCDRALLGFGPESRVAMLTSAGCNALDYLLDDVAAIHCVDMNPRQNALLDLKKAFLQAGHAAPMFQFFGEGAADSARDVYHDVARQHLPAEGYAQRYWDRHVRYFNGRGLRRSFYWHGSSGMLAWLIKQWMSSQPSVLRQARSVFEAGDLAQQRAAWEVLEPRILNPFWRWAVRQHVVQSMAGVPKAQQRLAAIFSPEEGMAGYIRHCFRHVFLNTDLRENYFWHLYFYGKYTPECCPNYLQSAHFDTLRSRVERVHTHTCSLNDFLKKNPDTTFSHFVLLDHQDWLAAHLRPVLEEEWHLIFAQATPNARVLLRSASFSLDFLPNFVHERVEWDVAAAQREHARDRVGTYGSTWVGTIRS
jgi:S-adenosylmethionine-diacylglycerol 3-amino-3-carboxypropyl transferase